MSSSNKKYKQYIVVCSVTLDELARNEIKLNWKVFTYQNKATNGLHTNDDSTWKPY